MTNLNSAIIFFSSSNNSTQSSQSTILALTVPHLISHLFPSPYNFLYSPLFFLQNKISSLFNFFARQKSFPPSQKNSFFPYYSSVSIINLSNSLDLHKFGAKSGHVFMLDSASISRKCSGFKDGKV